MQSELLQAILENSLNATIACDETGRVIFLNKKARECIDLANHEAVLSSLHRALAGQSVQDLEISFSSYYFLANAQKLVNEQHHTIGAMITLQDITETKLKNERLNSRFGAIFYQSPFSIQILSKEGKTLMVNPAFRALWGISEELVENYLYKFYNILEDHTLKESGNLSYILRGFEGEIVQVPPFHYDPSRLGQPGRSRWAGGIIYPLKDAHGMVQEVVIIHRDLTDQFVANQEKENLLSQLTSERNRLTTILNQIPVGVLVADAPYGDLSFRNNRMVELIQRIPFAQNVTEFLGFKVFFPDGTPYRYEDFPIVRSLKGETINEEVLTILFDESNKSIFNISSAPILNEVGEVTSCVVVAIDITRQKRTEAIQNFLDRLKLVLLTTLNYDQAIKEMANICVPFLCDACYVDLIEGDRVKRVMIHHHQPEKKKLMEEISLDYPPQLNSPQPSMRTLSSGLVHFERKVDEEAMLRTCFDQDHAQKVLSLAFNSFINVPLQVRNKTYGVISFLSSNPDRPLDDIDLTTCIQVGKHASLALDNALLYKEAELAIKLREDFISIASHELKTPLTSMNLQLAVLKSIIKGLEADESEYALKVLRKTNNQIQRLTKLIDDMLDISRIESGKFTIHKQEMDLTATTQEVLERFSEQFTDQGILVHFEAPGPLMLEGDPVRMDQVITNFITNAIRYGNRKPIDVTLTREDDHIIMKIKDHGPGISKEDQERIFNRFERSESSQNVPGLGLGLYINRQIVLEHGGTIKVESQPDEGATFMIILNCLT